MSMTQQIRDALAGGPKTFAELHGQIGGDDKNLRALVSYLKTKGEVKVADDEEQTVSLTKGATAAKRQAKSKPSKKAKRAKPARKAKARKPKRPYRKLVEKHVQPNGAALHALALDNLVHAGKLLRAQVADCILADTLTKSLGPAVDLYDRAAQIHEAAKQA